MVYDYSSVLGDHNLQCLFEEVASYLNENLYKLLTEYNRKGSLKSFLTNIGFDAPSDEDTINLQSYKYAPPLNSYVLVFGDYSVKQNDLRGIIKKLGLEHTKFEFKEYKDTASFRFSELEYSQRYSAVLFGPIPHKTKEMGDCSSIIAKMESGKYAYPHCRRITDEAKKLKITKSAFEKVLQDLISNGILTPTT